MGNGEFQISDRTKEEWTQCFKYGKRTFYNKITQEEFQLIVLSKIKNKCNISQLMQRSIYPIPKTPKLIVLKHTEGQLSVLIQRPTFQLKFLLSKILLNIQLLKILKESVQTIYALYNRYGGFEVREKMIGANSKSQIIAWINSDYIVHSCQGYIPDSENIQHRMLIQILSLINTLSPIKLDSRLIPSYLTTFPEFLIHVQKLIQQQRQVILLKNLSSSSKKISYKYPLSPRCHQNSMTPILKSQKLVDKLQKIENIEKRSKIPNFLRNIKNQNTTKNIEGISLKHKNVNKPQVYSNINRKANEDNSFNISKIRSLNGSPQPRQRNSIQKELLSTTNLGSISFGPSNKNIVDSLNLSKYSAKTQAKKLKVQPLTFSHKLKIPMNGLALKQDPSTGASLITQEIQDQVEVTFHIPANNSMGLNSFCKGLSQSQQFQKQNTPRLKSKKSLEQQGNSSCSVIIHQDSETSIFDGKCLSIYQQFHRILF